MELKEFLESLKAVGTNPFAFVAYICVFAGWVYVATSQSKLKAIEKLPAQDKAAMLAKEYHVFPKAGLTANQFIKSQSHKLLFLGFLTTVVAIVVLSTIAMVRTPSASSETVPQSPSGFTHHSRTEQIGTYDTDIEVEIPQQTQKDTPSPVIRVLTVSEQFGKPETEGPEFGSERAKGGHAWFYLPRGKYVVKAEWNGKQVSRPITVSEPDAHILIDMGSSSSQ